jgi:S-adenosylmethionine hydrolase
MLVALLTDFGLDDTYVGSMKAIIADRAPGVAIIDLTHAVPSQDVAAGAWHLATAAPWLPESAVVLAVVDPGVGTTRRAVAVQSAGRSFVAPDNGLLTRVLAQATPQRAVALDNPAWWLRATPSATFHGRDIFAPVAGRLAAGADLADAGSAIDPATLVRLALPMPTTEGATLVAHIIHIDHFGNLITDIGPALALLLFAAPQIDARLGQHTITARAATFGDAPDNMLFWYLDSSGHAAIAWRNGNAAQHVGATVGMAISLSGVPQAGG